MKKSVCVLLAVLLLLSGCGKAQQPQPTTEPETTGLYDPDHPVEQQTVGAVRAYPLGGDGYETVTLVGNKLLLTKADGTARVLQGENCEVMADGVLQGQLLDANAQHIALWCADSGEVVLLNPQLQEMERFGLPGDLQGAPVVNLVTNEVFYCQAGELRALNMENSVPRLVKVYSGKTPTVTGAYFDGKVLCCLTLDNKGLEQTEYLSAETGETLYAGGEISWLYTYENRYFLCREDNTVVQYIVGKLDGNYKALTVTEGLTEALSMNGVLSCLATQTGIALSFHDLSLEQTTAKLSLTECTAPLDMVADGQFVWMIMQEQDRQVLYRWDVKASALEEPVPVFGQLYTAQSPDREGLAECRTLADELDSAYGVRIRIWEDAVKQTGGYSAVPEYQPAVLDRMLTQLEPALQQFPQDFLRKTVRTGWIRICLVRSVDSSSGWAQFWANGDFYVLISSDTDAAQAFREAVWYSIDSRVIGNSRSYDNWLKKNPSGFQYGTAEWDSALLEGEDPAFVNRESVASPNEDRRQLFLAAITEGNETLFAGETLQSKLRLLCQGIREAYGLGGKKEIFLWEQYLKEPMVKIDG